MLAANTWQASQLQGAVRRRMRAVSPPCQSRSSFLAKCPITLTVSQILILVTLFYMRKGQLQEAKDFVQVRQKTSRKGEVRGWLEPGQALRSDSQGWAVHESCSHFTQPLSRSHLGKKEPRKQDPSFLLKQWNILKDDFNQIIKLKIYNKK